MFVCETCIKNEEVKIVNKEYALLTIEIGRGSYGPCEVCRKTEVCADV